MSVFKVQVVEFAGGHNSINEGSAGTIKYQKNNYLFLGIRMTGYSFMYSISNSGTASCNSLSFFCLVKIFGL